MCSVAWPACGQRSGLVNRLPNANVRPAAADVAVHCRVNISIRWLRSFRQQGSGGHHLACLAVAALRHVQIGPRELDRM
jgi:hypothetical protein